MFSTGLCSSWELGKSIKAINQTLLFFLLLFACCGADNQNRIRNIRRQINESRNTILLLQNSINYTSNSLTMKISFTGITFLFCVVTVVTTSTAFQSHCLVSNRRTIKSTFHQGVHANDENYFSSFPNQNVVRLFILCH